MATSGTISTAITSWLTLRVKWVRNSVSGLTSNVTVTAQLVTSGGNVNSSAAKDISLTINGTKYNSTCTIGIGQNSTKDLFTKTVNITHNADGTKSFAIACTLELAVTLSGTYYSSKSLSGTATLNTIAAKSTFTRSGTATMGNAQTIKITRKSSAYTHTLKYTWAGSTVTIATGIGTSYTWTPPVSMAAKILNATSGSCKLTLQTYNGTALVGTTTLTFTLSVPTKSTFTRSGTASLEYAQTITITSASSSFTHKLYYTWGGTKTLIGDIETGGKWTPPASMAAKIPNATSGSCVLTLETYNGTALVGSTTVSFTLSVPETEAYMPTVSAFTLAEAVSGLAAQFGGFVNTKSKIKYTVTAAGAQGSTIQSYSVSIANQKFTKNTDTTAVISVGSGTKTATVTVTDSRGRTAKKSVEYNVFAYAPPTFKNIYVKRCDANGNDDDNGTCMKFYVSVDLAAVDNKNTAAYSLAYKLSTASEYTVLTLSASGYSYSGTTVFTSPTFSTENTYDIKFTAKDYFVTTTSVVELPTARRVIDLKKNKKGVGIGKVSTEDNLLDIGFSTRFYGGITPIELEAGTDLNSLKQANFYASSSYAGDGTTGNYTNCPIVSQRYFYLEVLTTADGSRALQRLTVSSQGYSDIFERHYSGSTWGNWYRVFSQRGVVLWSGARRMSADQEITLSEKISEQVTGIELIFSPYVNGAAEDSNFNHFFVSKQSVLLHEGAGREFLMHRTNLNYSASKYLYISDTTIKGYENNNKTTATNGANGITVQNDHFVLRYVIGV